VAAVGLAAAKKDVKMPTEAEIARIRAAAPETPPAKPQKPRRVLVWGRVWTHPPNPYCDEAMKSLGEKTGAWKATLSDDPADLLPESLARFDALMMNNIHERDPFLPEGFGNLPKAAQEPARARDAAVKESILAFVRGGKGIAGVHAATAALQKWPEYGEMMGGYYGGHIMQEVPIKLDAPDHPVNACFGGKGWTIRDEIYLFRDPYSRKHLRVLLSLDLDRMEDPGKRADKDYAVSWVRRYGKGRVFYCSLGHCAETYWNATFLRHVLAGMQFVLGDLDGAVGPSE
jgi:type 1 glutamine amidotransferase